MGEGRAEGLSATGHGGQAAVSLMPDVDGTDSGELNSTHPFEKMIRRCLGGSSFLLVLDYPIALACVLNGCCNLRVLFYIQVLFCRN